MIITIDGPSGTGKSTVCKLLSKKLHFEHLDTGAFYRSFAWHVKENLVDPDDEEKLVNLLTSFDFSIKKIDDKNRYFLNQVDVTEQIRFPEIGQLSSKISVYPSIRKAIISLQRDYAAKKKLIAEGRDLGSVVFPKADLKFFLTADKDVRAQRRFEELRNKEEGVITGSLEQTLAELIERDKRDSERAISPLICPEGAVILDTSDMSIDQVVESMEGIIHRRLFQKTSFKKFLKIFFNKIVIGSFRLLFSLFYRLKIYGQENIGSDGGIIASNHVSFFDPPILACTAGIRVHFLARKTLFRIPVFKNLIRLLNAHPISGGIGDLSVIKLVQRLIQIQEKVIMFPEGTRSLDGELLPLKKGVANIIVRTGSTVYPAYIEGAYSIWNRNRKLPKLFGRVKVVYGKPIPASKYALLDRRQAQENLTKDLSHTLLSLKEWLRKGAKGPIP